MLMNITENDLDNIFEEFKERIVHVNFTQSFTKSVSKIALSKLHKDYEIVRDQDREASVTRMTNMICMDILKNQKVAIGFKDASYAEHAQILLLQHNRQYQWLLVEAYEAFEDFLEKLYAYSGYLDNDFWKVKNFEGKSADEIKKLDLDWFVEKAKNGKLEERGLKEKLKQINAKIDRKSTR